MSSRGVTPNSGQPVGQQTQVQAGQGPKPVSGSVAGLKPAATIPRARIGPTLQDWTLPTGRQLVCDLQPRRLGVPPTMTAMLLGDRDEGYDADDEAGFGYQARLGYDLLGDDVHSGDDESGDAASEDRSAGVRHDAGASDNSLAVSNGVSQAPLRRRKLALVPVGQQASDHGTRVVSDGYPESMLAVRPDLRTITRDVVKDSGASSGYLIQGGQKLLAPVVTGMEMNKLDQPLWKAWAKPESSTITSKGAFLKGASNAVGAMGDIAQPFKLLEYAGAAKRNIDEVSDYRKANALVAKWQRLDRTARDPRLPSLEQRVAADARDALHARKLAADQLIAGYDTTRKKAEALSGQVKGYAGFAKYGLGTFLAGKHCTDGLHHVKHGFWQAFKASAKATGSGAFGIASGVIGVIFSPASTAYYYWQGKKDTRKLAKVRAMQGRVASLASRVGQDALFGDVVERLRRKASKETFATKSKRWTNRFRSGIAAIGTVGSAAALAKAAGATAAVVAGAGAIAASWPFIVGVAGVTALGTAAYGIYKLARHLGSQGHKADLRQTFDSVRQFASSDRGSGATQSFYGAKSVRSVVEAMAADRACFDALEGGALLARFEAKSLTDGDLVDIAIWAERETVRSDTSATISMLLRRLVADGPDRSNGRGVTNAADLLHELGLADATIGALFNSAAAAFGQGSVPAQARALADPMKLLAKQLQLR